MLATETTPHQPTAMNYQHQEAFDSELNSRYDDQAERYASTALDPYYEAYCDLGRYLDEDELKLLSFEDFKAGEIALQKELRSRVFAPVAVEQEEYDPNEIPF